MSVYDLLKEGRYKRERVEGAEATRCHSIICKMHVWQQKEDVTGVAVVTPGSVFLTFLLPVSAPTIIRAPHAGQL